jgi:hypothetical protein
MTTQENRNERAPMPSAQPAFSDSDMGPVAAQSVPSTESGDHGVPNASPETELAQSDSPFVQDETSSTPAEASQSETVHRSAEAQPASGELPFTADISRLRSRWDDIQAVFVDDPADCVHKADALVAEVVEQVTAGLTEARSRLEAHWARGDQASTEDLRLALQRYREFFQRLLAA